MPKVIFVIFDGLGDRPIKELGYKTPLEAAKTPNLDNLAKKGITGLMDVIGVGIRPGSDIAHMTLFGYPINEFYHGRGPFECAGIGMDLKPGDIAFRCNLATVDKNLKIIDRRAGRISSVKEFVKDLNMEMDGVKFIIKEGTAHRAGLILRGKNLSHKISDPDPHEINSNVKDAKPLDSSAEAKFTASLLNKYLKKCNEILKINKLNKERASKKLPEANFLLPRGAGYMVKYPTFLERYDLKACCIAGAGLYKGIAKMAGMDILNVDGANGLPSTNVDAKIKTAVDSLKDYNFIFVHIKAADNLAEDGNFNGKKEFLQKSDKPFSRLLDLKDSLVVVTGDHSTSSELKKHTGDPLPILFSGFGVRSDDIVKFNERSCSKGGLGRIKGIEVMQEILNLIGKQKLLGD